MATEHKPIAIWLGDCTIIDPECPDCGKLYLVHDGEVEVCSCGCVFKTWRTAKRICVEVWEDATAKAREAGYGD
jgi:hypothetical protein